MCANGFQEGEAAFGVGAGSSEPELLPVPIASPVLTTELFLLTPPSRAQKGTDANGISLLRLGQEESHLSCQLPPLFLDFFSILVLRASQPSP